MSKLFVAALLGSLAVTPTVTTDIGQGSFGVAVAGNFVWVGGSAGDVVRLDRQSGAVAGRTRIGGRVLGLTSSPVGVWALDTSQSRAIRIDRATGKIRVRIKVGFGPYAVAWGFNSAWVTNSLSGTVSRITHDKVAKTIRVGVEPNGIAAAFGSVWVAEHTKGTLVRINPKTNRVTGSVKLAGADWVTAAGGALWVSQEGNTVAKVDPATMKTLATVPVGANPLGSAVVGNELWVPCIDADRIDVIDLGSGSVTRTIDASGGPIVIAGDGARAWVTEFEGHQVLGF